MLLTTKWEYKELDDPTAYDLNKAGQEGWELVSVVDIPDFNLRAYLKRPAKTQILPRVAQPLWYPWEQVRANTDGGSK